MVECLKKTDELGKEGLLQDGVHRELLRWVLEALSQLTPKQMEEFLFRVSQKELLQPEEVLHDQGQQPMQQA